MIKAQESSALAVAKSIDKEILKLNDLPDDIRARAIQNLALRIGRQPTQYAIPLASNLAVDGTEASGREALQEITTTLAEALRKLPVNDRSHDDSFDMLAELVRYDHTNVSLEDQRYKAAVTKLEADDRHRSESDFTLTDLDGRKWNLKGLRGRVVLINFWATGCPPCRKELLDLDAIYQRFQNHGLVILAISDEQASTLRRFLAQHKISYPLLLDPGQETREQFLVRGIPKSFVFNRKGDLVSQSIDRPSMQGFLEMLGHAGLR